MEITNEQGVLVLFAQWASAAGFEIVHAQQAFPDLIVRHAGEEYRTEVEYRASNFLRHGHDLRNCDLIICWENDFPDCVLPVIALSEPDWHLADLTPPSPLEREVAYWRHRALRAEGQLRRLQGFFEPEEEVPSLNPEELSALSAIRSVVNFGVFASSEAVEHSPWSKTKTYELLAAAEEAGVVAKIGHGKWQFRMDEVS